jgi:endonuclease G
VLIRNLIFYSGIALTLISGITKPKLKSTAPASHNSTFEILEDFEKGTKGSYAQADLLLPSGSWNFENALIGTSTADSKKGSKSVRLKTGSISMNFDISDITAVYISSAIYGNDPKSSWRLLVSMDGGHNYSQVGKTVTITAAKLITDTIKVQPFYKMRFKLENTGSTAAARINIDDFTFVKQEQKQVTLNYDSTNVTAQSFSGKTRGIIYGNDIQPEKGDNSNMLFGNPSHASSTTPENYFLDLKYYSQSYSRSRAIPNWVSWHLDASSTTSMADRLDNFAGFSELPPDYFVAQASSYIGSGFDRGHNCPSADRSSSKEANSATFLMTNMIPQAPKNNQRTWGNFEAYLRKQVDAGNEVYIIMGNYGLGGIGSKGAAATICNGNIAVPANLWKVAIILPVGDHDLERVNASTRIIAISTANINTIDPDWKKYRVTVNDIEKATGYDLLTALPERIQTMVEQQIDIRE